MNTFKSIREKLGLNQREMGEVVGCTQQNIYFIERGQALRTELARKLIAYAATKGLTLTLDDVYAESAPDSTDEKTT